MGVYLDERGEAVCTWSLWADPSTRLGKYAGGGGLICLTRHQRGETQKAATCLLLVSLIIISIDNSSVSKTRGEHKQIFYLFARGYTNGTG